MERRELDPVTAIVAVFVGGIGVALVNMWFLTPALIKVVGPERSATSLPVVGVHLLVAAGGSALGAALVCMFFNFDRYPTYARVFFALFVGAVVDVLFRVASLAGSGSIGLMWLNSLGLIGYILSVFILMSAPKPKPQGGPQWEYRLPPGAVWPSELDKPQTRRSRP
jgi:hypothetical protein